MKLEKAIEITENFINFTETAPVPDRIPAFKLVIEAGKLVESLRVGVPRRIVKLLPGETKE